MLELELKQPFIWNETVDESENIEFRNNKYLFCFYLLRFAISQPHKANPFFDNCLICNGHVLFDYIWYM